MINCSVSIIIPAYNSAMSLPRCLNSVFSQTVLPEEIITVDDGSTDNTQQVLRSFSDERIKIIMQENQGPAAARNRGLEIATGKYVAFLDADDYWEPQFIETTVNFLEEHPEAIAVNTAYCKEDWNGHTYYRPELIEQDKIYYGCNGNVCENFYEFWLRYRSVLTGTVMMRTEIAKKTGGQRKDLRLTEDLEFWGYLATFGKWGFIPKHLFVTDERILRPKERIRKLSRRVNFSKDISVESWISRIYPNLQNERSIQSFNKFIGYIATNITLANAYAFNFSRSYMLSLRWKDVLDEGLGHVLKYGLWGGRILWPFVCLLLKAREIVKAYIRPLLIKLRQR